MTMWLGDYMVPYMYHELSPLSCPPENGMFLECFGKKNA